MGVAIKLKSLRMEPAVFKRGTTTPARVFYKGLIDGSADNPVSVSLEATDDTDPIFFRDDDGVESKEIGWEHNLTTDLQEYFMDIDVVVDAATGNKTDCQIKLTATSKTGNSSSDIDEISHKA